MIFLPSLPFARDALAPIISEETVNFHYGKHHQAYVDNLNKLISGTSFEEMSLEEIIKISRNQPESVPVFNNAAQIWNHTFYWEGLRPFAETHPTPERLRRRMEEAFGSLETCLKMLKDTTCAQFGSGWGWLVLDSQGKLQIIKTGNAHTPFGEEGHTPLLTIDVWEHAYYLDYQNRRVDHVEAVLKHLVHWEKVLERAEKAL